MNLTSQIMCGMDLAQALGLKKKRTTGNYRLGNGPRGIGDSEVTPRALYELIQGIIDQHERISNDKQEHQNRHLPATPKPLYSHPDHWQLTITRYLGHDGVRDYYLVEKTKVFMLQGNGPGAYTYYLGELDKLNNKPWEK